MSIYFINYSKFFYNNCGNRGKETRVYLKDSEMRSRLMNRSDEFGDANIKYIVDDDYGLLSDVDLENFYVYK